MVIGCVLRTADIFNFNYFRQEGWEGFKHCIKQEMKNQKPDPALAPALAPAPAPAPVTIRDHQKTTVESDTCGSGVILTYQYQMSIFISNIRPDSKFSIRPENSALCDISPNIRLFFIPGCSGYLDRILYPAYLISSPCLNLPKLGVTSERNISLRYCYISSMLGQSYTIIETSRKLGSH